MPAAPLSDAEADVLLGPLGRYGKLIIAVSGGADSTALMALVAGWYRRRVEAAPDSGSHRAPDIVVATVDHGLRTAAAAEAAELARHAAALGLRHCTLRWEGDKPTTGIQAAARTARYRLLSDLVLEPKAALGNPAKPAAIVTAHTADDQAETVLMRLARGSGVDGLAGIPAQGEISRIGLDGTVDTIAVLRPLLDVRRDRINATLQVSGLTHSADPSNADIRFERVRVRKALAILNGLDVTHEALVRTASRMQRARAALNNATDALWRQAVTRIFGTTCELDASLISIAPEDVRIRLLRRALAAAGGAARPAELATIEATAARLFATGVRDARCATVLTLGGCIADVMPPRGSGPARIRIYREPDRDGGLPRLQIEPGTRRLWDKRFVVEVAADHAGTVEIGPLGDDVRPLIAAYPVLSRLPVVPAILRGLPVLRTAGGGIVAAPPLAELAGFLGDDVVRAALAGPLCGEAKVFSIRVWEPPWSQRFEPETGEP